MIIPINDAAQREIKVIEQSILNKAGKSLTIDGQDSFNSRFKGGKTSRNGSTIKQTFAHKTESVQQIEHNHFGTESLETLDKERRNK